MAQPITTQTISPFLNCPLGHLAVATMQYLSADMQQLQQSGAAPAARHSLLLASATELAHNCVAGASTGLSFSAPGVEHWLELVHGRPNYLLNCACMASTIAALRGALPADLIAPANRVSTSALAPTASTGDKHAAALWRRCRSRTDAVPDVCAGMLRLLSCSKGTILWAAARDISGDPDAIKRSVHMAHTVFERACAMQIKDPNSSQQSDKQAIEAALPLFWQLPAVALLSASQHPTGTRELDMQCMLACHSAVQLSQQVMYHSLCLQHVANGHSVRPTAVAHGLIRDEGGSLAPLPDLVSVTSLPAGTEVLFNYRLSPSVMGRPKWYVPVDSKEENMRWA